MNGRHISVKLAGETIFESDIEHSDVDVTKDGEIDDMGWPIVDDCDCESGQNLTHPNHSNTITIK